MVGWVVSCERWSVWACWLDSHWPHWKDNQAHHSLLVLGIVGSSQHLTLSTGTWSVTVWLVKTNHTAWRSGGLIGCHYGGAEKEEHSTGNNLGSHLIHMDQGRRRTRRRKEGGPRTGEARLSRGVEGSGTCLPVDLLLTERLLGSLYMSLWMIEEVWGRTAEKEKKRRIRLCLRPSNWYGCLEAPGTPRSWGAFSSPGPPDSDRPESSDPGSRVGPEKRSPDLPYKPWMS